MKSNVYDCIIIGGGASGLYCAAQLARTSYYAGKKTLIIEGGSRVGNKLALTGSGRCNLTNTAIELDNYNSDDAHKLASCFDKYGETDTSFFFENILGVVLENKGTLIYPATNKSSTVVDALRFYLSDNNVEVVLKEHVTSIERSDSIFEIKTDADTSRLAKNVVIATGGITYPNTGSTGDAPKLLESLTDKTCFIPYRPALTSLTSDMPGIKAMAGIRCRGRVKITGSEGTIKAESEGEILFTKDGGISGICVMDVSHAVVQLFEDGDENVKAVLNLTGRPAGEILQMLYIRRQMYAHRNCADALSGMLLRQVTEFVMKHMGLKSDKLTLRELDDAKMVELANNLCALPVPVTGYGGVDKAQVSSGGFMLSKLDDNMQIKYCPGLYVIGEAVNVNGICGGYNLQWAWTSAALAAEGISQNV